MINLIPPSAKKSIVTEYWLRVLSVWCFTWAFALVVGIFLLVPVYVLINLQVSTLSESAALASEKLANLKDVTGEFNLANQQARVLIEGSKRQPLSLYNTQFRELETTEVSLASITITRAAEGIAPVALTGEVSCWGDDPGAVQSVPAGSQPPAPPAITEPQTPSAAPAA